MSKKLVLRDNFVARGEPTLFDIEEEDIISQKIFERDQMLHYRMSEIHRVSFARKLLAIRGTEQDAFVSVCCMCCPVLYTLVTVN